MAARLPAKTAPQSLTSLLRLARLPLLWVALTLGVLCFALALLRPKPCIESSNCLALLRESAPATLHVGAVCGLSTLLLHEVASLFLHYRSAKPLSDIVEGVMDVFLPSGLLCVTFAILLAENVILLLESPAYLIHSPGHEVGLRGNKPVFTVIYMEWLINVPLLILLVGHCALGRAMRQVSGALIVTNVYIMVAWSSYFVVGNVLRWTLVCLSFAMYGWASLEMAQWILDWRRENREGVHDGTLRPLLCIGLIFIFGIYGIIFLFSQLGMLTSFQERAWFTCMNIGAKLAMSMAFAGIRSGAHHELLVDMLVNMHLPFQRQTAASKGSGAALSDSDEGTENQTDVARPPLNPRLAAVKAGLARSNDKRHTTGIETPLLQAIDLEHPA